MAHVKDGDGSMTTANRLIDISIVINAAASLSRVYLCTRMRRRKALSIVFVLSNWPSAQVDDESRPGEREAEESVGCDMMT